MRKTARILSLALVLLLTAGLLRIAPASVSAETNPFKSISVTLDDALTVNITAEITDTEKAVMTFALGDDTRQVPVTQAANVDGNLYTFSCRIVVKAMTDTITVTLADSGSTYTKETTVREYADKILASKQWDKLAANDIVISMLHYGAASQQYADYNVDSLANAGYTMPAAPEIESVRIENMFSGEIPEGLTFKGVSLYLTSSVALRFYFTTTGDIGNYTFSNGFLVKSGDQYYVQIGGINPQDYDKTVTLTVNDSYTITYSPLYYISNFYNSTAAGEELRTLLGTMHRYHTDAVAYVKDRLGNSLDNVVSAQ